MDFDVIIKRVINIITKTNEEWDKIQGESWTIKDLYVKFALILYAVPPIALLIGIILAGAPILMALTMAIVFYAITIGVIYLMGILIDVLSTQFGGTKDMIKSQTLAVFSFIPFAVVGILFILPIGGFFLGGGLFYLVILVSLYSIYVMYLGAPKLKNITQADKLLPFIIIMGVIWLILLYVDFNISARIAVRMVISAYIPRYR